VTVKLTVIDPPASHVQAGGASLVVQLISPFESLHLPPSLLVTAVIVIPGGGAQKKVSMNPIPLVLATSSWYLSESSHLNVVDAAASGEATGPGTVLVAACPTDVALAPASVLKAAASETSETSRRTCPSFTRLPPLHRPIRPARCQPVVGGRSENGHYRESSHAYLATFTIKATLPLEHESSGTSPPEFISMKEPVMVLPLSLPSMWTRS
jgi:hypothetical protein